MALELDRIASYLFYALAWYGARTCAALEHTRAPETIRGQTHVGHGLLLQIDNAVRLP